MKLHSCLANRIASFIALRRLAGTNYQTQIMLLEYFDRFPVKENVKDPGLSRKIIERYQVDISHLGRRSQYNRFSVVKQLCQYLAQFNPLTYIPESIPSAKSEQTHIPYIYTKTQVQALLAAAANLSPQTSRRPHTYRTLFGLLFSTGIRIGEAINLNLEDLQAEAKLLHIREGKFHKERWVPLASSTYIVLQKYIDRRMRTAPDLPDSPLFITLRSSRLHHCTIHQTFRRLLKQSGIYTGKGSQPRIHDLRHTFAVHRLLAWYRDGLDVNVRLPALATYMGHVDINSTRVYLQVTPELMAEANQRFLSYYRENIKPKGESA